MEWAIGAGIAIFAVISLWIGLKSMAYRRLFSVDHYAEVARAIGGIKTAAIERSRSTQDEGPTPLNDPRVLMTRHGLVIFYSITREEDRFVHHFSVSVTGGFTAHAVGSSFVLFVAKLVEIPFELLSLAVAPSTVHHAAFQLSPSEQAEYEGQPVRNLTISEIEAFRVESVEANERVRWERINVRPTPP